MKWHIFFAFTLCILSISTLNPVKVLAYQPTIESLRSPIDASSLSFFLSAIPIGDPTVSALGIFGRLEKPSEIDLYAFRTREDKTIPIEVLVPNIPKNDTLDPTYVLIGEHVPSNIDETSLPFKLPIGTHAFSASYPKNDQKILQYDPIAFMSEFTGSPSEQAVTSGGIYFFAVYSPTQTVGNYLIRLGDTINYQSSATDFTPQLLNYKLTFADEAEGNIPRSTDDQSQGFFGASTEPFSGFKAIDSQIRLIFQHLHLVGYRINLLLGGR